MEAGDARRYPCTAPQNRSIVYWYSRGGRNGQILCLVPPIHGAAPSYFLAVSLTRGQLLVSGKSLCEQDEAQRAQMSCNSSGSQLEAVGMAD